MLRASLLLLPPLTHFPLTHSLSCLLKVLADQQQVILKGVLEEPIDNKDNEATIKAKTFYKSCMDLRKYHSQPFFRRRRLSYSQLSLSSFSFSILQQTRSARLEINHSETY
jgi:hypothetical protein